MRTLALLALLLSATGSVALAQEGLPEAKSDTEAGNLETFRLWSEEVWGNGRLELVPDLVADEYVRHDADGTRVVTPEGYTQEIAQGRAVDLKFQMNAVSIDGNLLWTRWSASFQIPGGEGAVLRGIQIYRFADAKLAETWPLTATDDDWPDN